MMHVLRRGVTALAVITLGAAGAAVPAGSALADGTGDSFCADGTTPMASVADVEAYAAGTAVTGKSVVQGTTPTPFTGSYIGYVADGLGKGKDLLLFQLSSDVIDGTGTMKAAGIWAGMSGSPVYAADGSLIGAVSYSLNADNIPVAGVTPAEYMKTIGSTTAAAPKTVKVTDTNLERAAGIGARSATARSLAAAADATTALHQVGLANVARTSARATAFTNRLLARQPKGSGTAATRLRSRSFTAVGTTDAAHPMADTFVPGGNIAVLYSTDDALAGAVGTVTAICGSQVWAFGHPMDYAGRTVLGMAGAAAAMIVPDGTGLVGSYKQVTTIGEPVGTITEDRLAGVRGALGSVPGYPVTLSVRSPAGTQVDSRRTSVIEADMGPDAAATLVGNAAMEDLDNAYHGTVGLAWSIAYRTAAGRTGTIRKYQLLSDPESLPYLPADAIGNDMYALLGNGFTDVTITKVAMTMTLVSQDALVYKVARAQVYTGGRWAPLNGMRLKAGRSYAVRPVYTKLVGTHVSGPAVNGPKRTIVITKKARRSGQVAFAAVNDAYSAACDEDECDDLSDDVYDAGSFTAFVAALSQADRSDEMAQRLSYRRAHGGISRTHHFYGPGVVTGTSTTRFTIRR